MMEIIFLTWLPRNLSCTPNRRSEFKNQCDGENKRRESLIDRARTGVQLRYTEELSMVRLRLQIRLNLRVDDVVGNSLK